MVGKLLALSSHEKPDFVHIQFVLRSRLKGHQSLAKESTALLHYPAFGHHCRGLCKLQCHSVLKGSALLSARMYAVVYSLLPLCSSPVGRGPSVIPQAGHFYFKGLPTFWLANPGLWWQNSSTKVFIVWKER